MDRSYTPAERRKRALLVLRGAKQAVGAGVAPSVDREIDRIDEAAEERGQRERQGMADELEAAKKDAANAKTKERIADRKDRPAATQTRKDAERTLDRVQRAARRYGLH